MQKSAPSIGKILVAAGFALSCFALILFLWVSFGGPVPLTFDNSGDPAGVPGFDPNFGTVVGPETRAVNVRTPGGISTVSPGAVLSRLRLITTSRPTIRRASSFGEDWAASISSVTLPWRITVTRSATCITSSSLWVMSSRIVAIAGQPE